jgi:hypothetical protein
VPAIVDQEKKLWAKRILAQPRMRRPLAVLLPLTKAPSLTQDKQPVSEALDNILLEW